MLGAGRGNAWAQLWLLAGEGGSLECWVRMAEKMPPPKVRLDGVERDIEADGGGKVWVFLRKRG
jgi:hypothetical protein